MRRLIWVFIFVGLCLRFTWLSDMEYKWDENYMVERVLGWMHGTIPWEWLGMPSGVALRNPGMSIWVFQFLGWIFQVEGAVGLARAVVLCNCLAIVLIPISVDRYLPVKERESWYWGAALVALNPLAIMVHRKIWAQSILPLFCVLFLVAWWNRKKFHGAFAWGLIGACLGQIHMSGFFFAAGFMLWALLRSQMERKAVNWLGWFSGSVLGALTLLPWLQYWVTDHPRGKPLVSGFQEAVQLKFWVFWVSDALGLHVGHQLGVLRGNGLMQQLEDFLRYPLLGEQPTYLMAASHLGILICAGAIFGPAAKRGWKRFQMGRLFGGKKSETSFTLTAALASYGGLLTLATIWIRRYYLIITYPMEWVWIARTALNGARGQRWLIALCFLNASISITVLLYVHRNGGAPQGEYGTSYSSQFLTPNR